ncbi:hypothetical protein XENOCAPTIV_027214 [Xenoophorus captivus]|uniref:Uncharacterized protein n=1 Tax=Xenoophorus captivus TaxID=1517983 RepID=A0ABV0QBM9_9TELE
MYINVPFKFFAGQGCDVKIILSFIFYTAYSIVCHGGAGAYLQRSVGERQSTPWTGRQLITGQQRDILDKQPHTHSFTPKGNLERPTNSHVFGLWEEAGVPGENPCMNRENMQTPCRMTPGRESNPTVILTAPPCSPVLKLAKL